MTNAAIYARLSRDDSGDKPGIDRQIADCRELLARKGWTDAQVFTDRGLSAYRGKARPGFTALLAAIESGEVTAVVAWAPDRFTRYMPELEWFAELIERTGCAVATVQGGDWDLTTPEGRFNASIMGRVARLEAEKTGARVKRARLQAAQEGRPHASGGHRPWGFESDGLTHHEAEAEQVRDVARRVLAGESLRSAAMRYGKRPKDVRRALLSWRMAGYREHLGQVYPAQWAPILDRDTWEAIRALLLARSREKVVGVVARKYLLSGFVVCGVEGCGHRAFGVKQGDRFKYVAHPCGHVAKAMHRVDDAVRDDVLVRADLRRRPNPIDPALTGAVAGYQARLERARELFIEGALDKDEYASMKRDLESRLAEARQALEHAAVTATGAFTRVKLEWFTGNPAEPSSWDAASARGVWEEMDLLQRRRLIERYVERVVLHRNVSRRQFERESVEVIWREVAS